jgi:hypothetical protein
VHLCYRAKSHCIAFSIILISDSTVGYRYGRQTFSGLVKDGISALSRYYLNNFQDGIRQVHIF